MFPKKAAERIGSLKTLLVKYKYIVLILAVGLILLAWPSGSKDEKAAEQPEAEESFDLNEFETRLGAALQKIEGVGKTRIVLTLKTDSERVLAEDPTLRIQTDGAGGEDMDSQSKTVLVSAGSGVQQPVVVKRVYPQFQGALIICQGGGNSSVRLSVTEAVAAVTGLGSDKIKVCKMA